MDAFEALPSNAHCRRQAASLTMASSKIYPPKLEAIPVPAGRPPKPLVLLEMSGSTKRNPARYKNRVDAQIETKGPIGGPPESFANSSQRIALTALWEKLVSELPSSMLTSSDREALEQICRWGVDAKSFSRTAIRSSALYYQALRRMGGTPDGRAAMGIGGRVAPTKTSINKLDSFLAKGRRKSA